MCNGTLSITHNRFILSFQTVITEQIKYIKIIFICVVAFAGVGITIGSFVLSQFLLFGSHNHEISDEEYEKIQTDILQRNSVTVFKELYPDHREEFQKDYNISYVLQTQNPETGVVLSLNVIYDKHPQHESVKERLTCIPFDDIIVNADFRHHYHDQHLNLYIMEFMENTKCMDDDYEPRVVIVDR